MNSRWTNAAARRAVKEYGEQGVPEELALRVYTTRLLGQDPQLVLHGGGNTSVKMRTKDMLGDNVDVLCVKGSGWDMGDIEAPGLPPVRLEPLVRLRSLKSLSDEDMVNFQRINLLDSSSPNPSVETLLHAFLPHKFIDHTHSNAILSLTNQPNGEELCHEVFRDSVGLVPYIMPGFALAKKAAEVFEKDTNVQGLIALKHGIFTFGETAEEAYARMIDLVTQVEERLRKGRKRVFAAASIPPGMPTAADVAPIIRGACSIHDESGHGNHRRFLLNFRTSPEILAYVNGKDIARYSQVGVATPDHTIRTKNLPLLAEPPSKAKLLEFRQSVYEAVATYVAAYHKYFDKHNRRVKGIKTELDPMPRVALVPGLGLFGLGNTARDASVAADIAESTVQTITNAESIGAFESATESDLFDIEYWSLEQAKLGSSTPRPFQGQVAVITGGAGAIGAATAAAFQKEGAEVAVLDLNAQAAKDTAASMGRNALAVQCDVTDAASVRSALDKICETFGGLDIVVSNAGAAWQGKIGDVSDELLRKSFELNFFAHQTVAQNAVRVMRAQGTGGVLLFNTSKQAVNPGPDFGPYGLPKAATLFLVRQYALDHGAEGIRANAVNADRIRSGLLTPEMIDSRSKARGVSQEDYMSGNLLGREVTAEDVAQAFVHQALEMKTTASVTTVDGGNISAILR
ncbi:MAG: bifunctional aldolase/short-chain dehydrogenase [Chloroflexi bacterium]|nr:bifunctional aldolase/short-chain dehydrogenase [Chloroflexota bacterium]